MKILDKVYNIIKPKRNMKGKKVKLIKTPYGLTSSNNYCCGSDKIFIVYEPYYGYERGWRIQGLDGELWGFAYEWEMQLVEEKREDFEKKLKELNDEVEIIKTKIEWLDETGNDVWDEDEYKVYQTLKLWENDKMSKKEKSKIIAELIRK